MINKSHQIPAEIYPIPDVPPEIRNAVSNEKLIVFLGAGASRIIGCPGWKELADRFVDRSFENEIINHWEKEKLKSNDPRKMISIAKEMLGDIEYEKIMNESLQMRDVDLLKKFPIYECLIRLRGIYVTTNIDTHFDSFFESQRVFIQPSQFKTNLQQNTLHKLHGSLTDIKKVVFTTQDYISHYNNTDIKKFLERIFSGGEGYTILFVGYSLAELEVLDYILLKGDAKKQKTNEQKVAKNFVLLPFYRSEKGLLRFERDYFNTLDVVTVPYAIDDKGYDQLYFVIEAWENEINVSTPYLYKSYELIEKNAGDFIESNSSEIFQLIKNDEHFRVHFFRQLRTVKWFTPLKEKGYFSSENAPDVIPSGQEGYYSFPEWIVLPYLEWVSQQVAISGNEPYIDELIAIIDNVSNFRSASGKSLDNYRTWHYFVKILLNLPSEKITGEIIDHIPAWLDSKFRAPVLGAEITKKLLLKLLDSDDTNDWDKAEKLIEIFTRIKEIPKAKKTSSFLERDTEFKIIIESYWLNDFSEIFKKAGRVCSISIIETVAKRILEILGKEHPSSKDIDYKGKKYRIAHKLKGDKHQISVYSIFEGADDCNTDKMDKLETSFPVENFVNKIDFIAKVREGLIQGIFFPSCAELDEAISSIYSLHDYTYVGYASLDASLQNIYIDDTQKILIHMLTRILSVKACIDNEVTGNILEKFISRDFPFPLFKRLVLYIVRKKWDWYKDYFFKIIVMDEISCFDECDYEEELYAFLKDNFGKFSVDEKNILKQIIDAGPRELPTEDPEKYRARWKQGWLSLLTEDPSFADLFEEQKKITGIEGEGTTLRPSIFRVGFGMSPLTAEDILSLPGVDLARKLKEFRSENAGEGITVEGFAESLKEAVNANPGKFTEGLGHFQEVGFIYVCNILAGLKDAWKAKKEIDWGKVFDFIASYINRETFWRDDLIVEKNEGLRVADHKWVVGIISDLIVEGVRDHSWAFSKEYFDRAKDVVFSLLREPEEVKEIENYLFHLYNSAYGKSVFALVLLALRIARSEMRKNGEKDPKWSKEIREKFHTLVEGDKVGTVYACLGRYLQYFAGLDKEWVADSIKQAILIKGTMQWQAFMEGYLSARLVYEPYNLIRPHYEYALTFDFQHKHDREFLIQHICIGYLRGDEKLDESDSLFRKIIDAWNPEQLLEVISFFRMQRNQDVSREVLEFWKWLYGKYKKTEESSWTEEDKRILSAVSRFAVYLREIDKESFEWLDMSAPYVDKDFNCPHFIKSLDMLKDKGDRKITAEYIGKLYLKMLNSFTPDFDQNHIKAIVEFLYDVGEKKNANKICNIHGKRGHGFLREIYNQRNQ